MIASTGRAAASAMNQPRIIFAGTPEFAAVSLAALLEAGRRPCAVLTQPDRPAGRGKTLTASPVKKLALEHDIAVQQPATLRDDAAVAALAALEPDIMIVAAYGLILPQPVLELPPKGCVNVHASLLPRWRGAAPIQAAILAGDDATGVCLMQMEAGLDTGPVFACESIAIGERDTAGILHDRVAIAGGNLLLAHLEAILDGALEATPQDDALATYAPKIRPADAELDWSQPATTLERVVRAYNPVPGAWFTGNGERIKCWAARTGDDVDAEPGHVVASGADGVVVACGSGSLVMESLQRPGKRAVTAAEFSAQADLRGARL